MTWRPLTLSAAGILAVGMLFAQNTTDLTKVLDQYLAAVKANDFQKIIALYHSAAKKAVLTDFETPTEQKEFLKQIAEMTPDGYEAPEVGPGGDRVILRIMAKKNIPPAIQKKNNLPPFIQKPMIIEFVQEGGLWKMGPPSFSASPAEIVARPKNLIGAEHRPEMLLSFDRSPLCQQSLDTTVAPMLGTS